MKDTQPPRMRRSMWIALAVLLLAGVVVRAAYLREVVQAPDFAHPVVDAWTHDYWARGLATGDWTPPRGQPDPLIPTTPYFRPPAYPYFLAGVYALTSENARAARMVQMLLGLVSALLVFTLGRRWFGDLAALVATAGMCLWWVLVYFEGELQAEPLLLPMLLGVFVLLGHWLYSGRTRTLVLASLLLGLAALTRPNVLVLVVLLPAWVILVQRREGGERGGRVQPRASATMRPTLLAVLLAVLPALLVVSLATIRNHRVSGQLVWVSANGGINLYIGNNPQANGFAASELEGIGRFATCFDMVGVLRQLERTLQRPMDHAQASRWFAGEARRYAAEHPAQTLRLLWKKVCLQWGPREVGNNKELELERQHSGVLRRLPGSFAVLASAAIVGVVVLWRRRRQIDTRLIWLMLGTCVALFAAILPFFAAGRFRVPLLPFLFLFAGVAVQQGVDCLRQRRLRALAMGAALFVVLVLLHRNLPYAYVPDAAAWHFTRGTAWSAGGDLTAAERSFRTAIDIEPRHFQARHNLALLLSQRGEHEQAMDQWQQALQVRPDATPVLGGLGGALLLQQRAAEALPYLRRAVQIEPQTASLHASLAQALQAVGDTDGAVLEMQQAAMLQPDNATFWRLLGNFEASRNGTIAMLQAWRQSLALQPEATLANNVAWILATHPDASVRDGTEALRLATAACEATQYKRRPFLDTLAAAQAETGDYQNAVATTERSLALARDGAARTTSPDSARTDDSTQVELLEHLRARLATYQTGQPHRDTTLH